MEKVPFIKKVIIAIFRRLSRGNRLYPKFLKFRGISLGNDIWWGDFKTLSIDDSRPSLVTIGNNVRVNTGFTLMTHDASSMVLRKVYKDFVPASGRVTIGNNVYFGRYCTVLRGTSIGDNCIIGFGSIVTKSIPANSVAIGRPARVICSLDEYYKKRKEKCISEALDYARSIQERYGRKPVLSDFFEEFPLFFKGDELYDELPIKEQLKESYDYYRKHNEPVFDGFDDFLIKAGIK